MVSIHSFSEVKEQQTAYQKLPSFIIEALNDPLVEEVSADANNKVTTDGYGGRKIIGTMNNNERHVFLNEAAFYGNTVSGKLVFSYEHPFLSVMLPKTRTVPSVVRLEGQHDVLSLDGCSFTLRKFGDILRLSDFTMQGMITKEQEDFLKSVVGRANIIVAGETRCGKTTFVKALLEEVQHILRWVAIEKNTELQQPIYGNRIQLNKVATFEDAIQSALRYNPTLIVISEINSTDSAFAYVEAAMTGHFGLSTIHAGSVEMVPMRLAMRMAKYNTPQEYIDMSCQVVVHIALRNDNSRYVTKIKGM